MYVCLWMGCVCRLREQDGTVKVWMTNATGDNKNKLKYIHGESEVVLHIDCN